MAFLSGIFGKKKKPALSPQISNVEPPPTPKYLREVEQALFDIVPQRAKGIGVGYDPARRTALEELLKSQIGKREEDDIRSAQGMVSSSGLSGNVRAREAVEGRVRRDSARNLSEGLTNITIEDLARANEERNINTARLADFNKANFGQSKVVSDFNLRKGSAVADAMTQERTFENYERFYRDEKIRDIIKAIASGASGFGGGGGRVV